jgi:hypothetical protein
MSIPLVDIGYATTLVLIAVMTWRESRRADRLSRQLEELKATLDTDFVPRERYEESAHARRLLEDSLREGFLPALQDAVVANRDSLGLIRRFQDEHVRLNKAREEKEEAS